MPDNPQASSPIAPSFARPLRWIGNGTCAFGGLAFAGVFYLALDGDIEPEFGTFIVPAIFVAIGFALRRGAISLSQPGRLDLPTIGGYAFSGLGVLMAVGGTAMAFDDPVGFVLIAFGLLFFGAGYLARRLFATPEGKKAVFVSGYEAPVQNYDGTSGIRRQDALIYVDEDATDAEVEARKRAWLEAEWKKRPDWASGRIAAEDQRLGATVYWAAGAWSAIAGIAVLAALAWDSGVWFGAAPVSVIALALIVSAARTGVRRRKFQPSELVLRQCPAVLGGRLHGEVQTGMMQRNAPADGFRVALRCIHQWEESDSRYSINDRRTYYRRKTLWETDRRCTPHAYEREGLVDSFLAVAVDLEIPKDQPETTLGNTNEGISWEMEVTAPLKGVDYAARFKLPVFAPGNSLAGGR